MGGDWKRPAPFWRSTAASPQAPVVFLRCSAANGSGARCSASHAWCGQPGFPACSREEDEYGSALACWRPRKGERMTGGKGSGRCARPPNRSPAPPPCSSAAVSWTRSSLMFTPRRAGYSKPTVTTWWNRRVEPAAGRSTPMPVIRRARQPSPGGTSGRWPGRLITSWSTAPGAERTCGTMAICWKTTTRETCRRGYGMCPNSWRRRVPGAAAPFRYAWPTMHPAICSTRRACTARC